MRKAGKSLFLVTELCRAARAAGYSLHVALVRHYGTTSLALNFTPSR